MELEPKNEVTERDILEFAIDAERQASQMYLAAADSATDEGAQSLLLELANEERDHEMKLNELIGKVEARDPLDKKFEPGWIEKNQEVFDKMSLPADTTTEGALKFGIEREKAMLELYKVFSHLISGGAFGQLLNYLADEERGHLKKLEKLLAHNIVDAE